jgi:hypothetical protein
MQKPWYDTIPPLLCGQGVIFLCQKTKSERARMQDKIWTKKVCAAVFVVSLVLFALIIEKVLQRACYSRPLCPLM